MAYSNRSLMGRLHDLNMEDIKTCNARSKSCAAESDLLTTKFLGLLHFAACIFGRGDTWQSTSGTVTDEMILEYIEEQEGEQITDDS